MKPGSNYQNNRPRRPRRLSNNNRRPHGNGVPNPNRHWESLGPNVRIRGSATQIYDKYVGLAEDAKRSGDRVLVENLKQHAEHYLRLMNLQQAQRQERQSRQQSEEKSHAESRNAANASQGDGEGDNTQDAIVEDLTPKAVSQVDDSETESEAETERIA